MQPQPEHSVKTLYCHVVRAKVYIYVETTRIYGPRPDVVTVREQLISCGGMGECRLFPTRRFPLAPPKALTGCPAIDPRLPRQV